MPPCRLNLRLMLLWSSSFKMDELYMSASHVINGSRWIHGSSHSRYAVNFSDLRKSEVGFINSRDCPCLQRCKIIIFSGFHTYIFTVKVIWSFVFDSVFIQVPTADNQWPPQNWPKQLLTRVCINMYRSPTDLRRLSMIPLNHQFCFKCTGGIRYHRENGLCKDGLCMQADRGKIQTLYSQFYHSLIHFKKDA